MFKKIFFLIIIGITFLATSSFAKLSFIKGNINKDFTFYTPSIPLEPKDPVYAPRYKPDYFTLIEFQVNKYTPYTLYMSYPPKKEFSLSIYKDNPLTSSNPKISWSVSFSSPDYPCRYFTQRFNLYFSPKSTSSKLYIGISSHQPNTPVILKLKYPADPDQVVKQKSPLPYCPQKKIFWGDIFKDLLLVQNSSPQTQTASGVLQLRTSKNTYLAGEPIKVYFQGFPGNKQDWISLAYPYYQPNQSLQWQYTNGQRQGTINFKGLPAGSYEVRAYFNWPQGKYVIKAKVPFKVVEKITPLDELRPKNRDNQPENTPSSFYSGITIEAEKEFAQNVFFPSSPQEQAWRSRKLKNLPHSGDGYWYLSRKGDWVAYLINVPASGNYKFWIKDLNDYKHPHGARSIIVSLDGEVIGTFPENSNSQNNTDTWGWHKLTSLYLSKGQHILILKKAKTTSAAAVIDTLYFTLGNEVPSK